MSENDNEKNEIFENLRKRFVDSLSEEDKEAYKRFGEKFYSIDFTEQNLPNQGNVINLEECLANICRGLNSGLHPKYIEEDEERVLKAAYGDKWFENWGYKSKNDIKE